MFVRTVRTISHVQAPTIQKGVCQKTSYRKDLKSGKDPELLDRVLAQHPSCNYTSNFLSRFSFQCFVHHVSRLRRRIGPRPSRLLNASAQCLKRPVPLTDI